MEGQEGLLNYLIPCTFSGGSTHDSLFTFNFFSSGNTGKHTLKFVYNIPKLIMSNQPPPPLREPPQAFF